MSTVELIAERASSLPAELQQEALRYVDYLLSRSSELDQAVEWTRFSEANLAEQYTAADAIYDED
jgi:hypothetical protein